jgi:xanthine dehydrogenase small subunit
MRDRIQFILDERKVEVEFTSSGTRPTTTVLNYLRSLPGHKGVKEGCAEGDCGACTVVIASLGESGKLTYKAVDSCLLFLPMIHGKQLITVENLAVADRGEKKLHPVQIEMVRLNGSQCGYCTPGIVMSLFGLYKNHQNPSPETVRNALSGNLCRCTGYQPILDAALKACSTGSRDHFAENEGKIIQLLNEINSDKEPVEISGSGQCYFRPLTLKDALKTRKIHTDALIINGSTDVALRQTKKHEFLPMVLDLSGISEMKGIREEKNAYTIGAGATLEQVRKTVQKALPALSDILSVFGSLQIRNIATLGGNICSASPIGDTIPLLFALGAEVRLKSSDSDRVMGIEQFITGYRKTVIREDEILTEIVIPVPAKDEWIFSRKVSRRKDLDISTVSAAYKLKLDRTGKVADIVMAYGGMSASTKRASETEKFLTGKMWSRETVKQAGEILAGEFEPITDARAEASYRSRVASNLLLRFYLETNENNQPV